MRPPRPGATENCWWCARSPAARPMPEVRRADGGLSVQLAPSPGTSQFITLFSFSSVQSFILLIYFLVRWQGRVTVSLCPAAPQEPGAGDRAGMARSRWREWVRSSPWGCYPTPGTCPDSLRTIMADHGNRPASRRHHRRRHGLASAGAQENQRAFHLAEKGLTCLPRQIAGLERSGTLAHDTRPAWLPDARRMGAPRGDLDRLAAQP